MACWLAGWLVNAHIFTNTKSMARIGSAITNYAPEYKYQKYAKKIMIYQHAVNENTIKIKDFCLILVQKRLDKFRSRHFDQEYTTGVMVFFAELCADAVAHS
jgi:hypothetical protein